MKTLRVSIAAVSIAVITALAPSATEAGSLAPAPRVVAKYERAFIERSGAQTLQELLDTGIARYFLTGGQSLLVLVNGRPYATTASDLDSLPLSAIERIELLGGETLGTYGGIAVRGALNIVLRTDIDGFETRGLARLPNQDGGDGWQGSGYWGGAFGKGRMTVGVDVLERQEIPSASRDYSRSDWTEGGAFNEASNVSVGGNTVWVIRLDEDGIPIDERSVALGECDPARGYTGPLSNPPGITSGDKGCGFAYGRIAWETSRFEQQSAVLNLDYPLTDETDLHVDTIVRQTDSAFRYAPSVATFTLTGITPGLLEDINEAGGSDFVADDNDVFVVAHRFVRHGNRDWRTELEEVDFFAGLEGRLAEGVGYDARVNAYRGDGFVDGNTFVHVGRITEEIENGRYDLANPFSNDPSHLRAIEDTSLRLERDVYAEYQSARFGLEGSGFATGGGNLAWTTGLELERVESRDVSLYRDNEGGTHDVSQVAGSGGASYSGRRRSTGAFVETAVPLARTLDLRLSGRADDLSDVGRLESWRLGADYRPTGVLTLRGSWSAGDRPPSMLSLYSHALQSHPYVVCDPGPGSPPRTCHEFNPRQVTRVTTGNPNLDPSSSARLGLGAEARRGPFFVDLEWYRLSRADLPGLHRATWAILNLDECTDDDRTNCIERSGGDITIHDSFENVTDVEVAGLNTRFGGGFRTSEGVVGFRGALRRIHTAERRTAGAVSRLPIPADAARVGLLARRGGLSFVWTTHYRSGYRNSSGTGEFKSWTGHDAVVDWTRPFGLDDARVTAGVFNVTNASLSVDTTNPSSVDGPTEGGWGRTYFLSLKMQF